MLVLSSLVSVIFSPAFNNLIFRGNRFNDSFPPVFSCSSLVVVVVVIFCFIEMMVLIPLLSHLLSVHLDPSISIFGYVCYIRQT